MRRHGHDRARAVAHQDIVRYENRDLLAVNRVDGCHTVELDASLVLVELGALKIGLTRRFLAVGAHRVYVCELIRPLLNRRMLGRDDHIGRAEQRVRTGGIDGQGISLGSLEVHLCAGRAANPVALLHLDALDVIHIVQIVDQALRILGDGQHPLALGLVHNLAAAALAHAVNDLFIRQHALAGRTPVDVHFLLVSQAVLEQLQEDPLGPLVVVRVGGVDLARPVERQAERLELALETRDVLLGHLGRMDVVFDGIVLGRQAERVPAHRIEHIIALHALLARDDIQRGVRARMADVQALAGRVRELDERVKLLLVAAVLGLEAVRLVPDVLPLLFDLFMIVLQRNFPLK